MVQSGEKYYSGISGIASENLIEQLELNGVPVWEDIAFMTTEISIVFIDAAFSEGKEDSSVNGLTYDFDARVMVNSNEQILDDLFNQDEEGYFHITGQITVDEGMVTNCTIGSGNSMLLFGDYIDDMVDMVIENSYTIEMTEEPDYSFLNTLVNEAIEVLAESWNDYCWDSNNPDKEYTLDIRSTRVICIKDAFDEAQEEPFLRAQEELFGNVQYVIEFLTYADYMTDGVYTYPMVSDVIIYDDGSMEWARMGNYIDEYRGRTFSNDFSAFIDQVIDLHEDHNQMIRFQNHEIFFEEVLE